MTSSFRTLKPNPNYLNYGLVVVYHMCYWPMILLPYVSEIWFPLVAKGDLFSGSSQIQQSYRYEVQCVVPTRSHPSYEDETWFPSSCKIRDYLPLVLFVNLRVGLLFIYYLKIVMYSASPEINIDSHKKYKLNIFIS